MNTKHTPTPLRAEKLLAPNGSAYYRLYGEGQTQEDGCVAQVIASRANDYQAAECTAYILRCVNAWDDASALRARIAELEAGHVS